VSETDAARPIVHVHGGRLLLEHIADAGLPGERLEWCDVLCDGPTPAGLAPDVWYSLRAEYHEETSGPAEGTPYRERLIAQDRALAQLPGGHEVVLWFGPELFCQSILLYLLAWFDGRSVAGGRLSLVSPADTPGRPGCSVSFLSAAELRAAFALRQRVGRAQTELARRAWEAFCAPDPRALDAMLDEDTSALPHLDATLQRHLAELPAHDSGLAESERHALEAIAAGARSFGEAFAAAQRAEARPWLTDVLFAQTLARLAAGPAPLVRPGPPLELTDRAQAVLSGRDRFCSERWRGGVHLDEDSPWRWDRARRRLAPVG
jgi:hypothetical protein